MNYYKSIFQTFSSYHLIIISCLKLYCQCFALSTTCGPKCKCQTCFNTTLHADAIADARKTILERNPSAFDDKFRGGLVTPSPYRAQPPPAPLYLHQSPPVSAWPASAYSTPSAMPPPPFTSTSSGPRPPLRVNKFGCKCRRSFCLKKVRRMYRRTFPRGYALTIFVFFFTSTANATKIP